MANFRSNEEATVNEALEEALTADSVIESVKTLRSIAGVQVPMASAFLLFMDPAAYTVIDQKAWTVLREFGYLSNEHDNHSTEQYLLYLGTCRSLATEYDVSLRDLDRALWMIGGEL